MFINEVKTYEQKKILLKHFFDIFPDSWSQESFLSFINNFYIKSFLFYSEDDVPIGICIISSLKKEVEILKFGIKHNFRSRGFGYFFLKNVIQYCESMNTENIFLEVSSQNLNAISLYLKLGFKKIKIRENYYRNSEGYSEDAIVFKKEINFF